MWKVIAFRLYIVALVLLTPFFFHLDFLIYSLIAGWILTGISTGVLIHRKYSHNQFEYKNVFFEFLGYIIMLSTSQGSPVGWSWGHRVHHRYTDQLRDPQSPFVIGKFRVFFSLFPVDVPGWDGIINDLIKDRRLMIFHQYYFLFLLAWHLMWFMIDPILLIYAVAIPSFVNTLILGYVNTFAHDHPGKTRNVLNPILFWGECYHKTHHDNPKLKNQGPLDLSYYIMKVIGK